MKKEPYETIQNYETVSINNFNNQNILNEFKTRSRTKLINTENKLSVMTQNFIEEKEYNIRVSNLQVDIDEKINSNYYWKNTKTYINKHIAYDAKTKLFDINSKPLIITKDIDLKVFRKYTSYEDLNERSIYIQAEPSFKTKNAFDLALIKNYEKNNIYVTKSINEKAIHYHVDIKKKENLIQKFGLNDIVQKYEDSKNKRFYTKDDFETFKKVLFLQVEEDINNGKKLHSEVLRIYENPNNSEAHEILFSSYCTLSSHIEGQEINQLFCSGYNEEESIILYDNITNFS